jgi:hypothetical protein
MSKDYRVLKWQIGARDRIQRLSLDIVEQLKNGKELSHTTGLLIGTAFALWRAAFLATPPGHRQHENVLEQGIELLEKVVEDNSIGYSDYSRWKLWVFGYYVNNARFRIQQMAARDASFREALGGMSRSRLGICVLMH